MFAEMTPASNHTQLISRKGFERNWCTLCRQQKPRTEKILSGSRAKEQKNPKSPSFKNRLKFCYKRRASMEQREPQRDPHAEMTEGRLRDLASKWFIETQLPLIVHNGFFPTWFLGFISRKDAEDILREKELGCFLVRLSEKAIGYILSYKGRDRCRHFVINQSEKGQFVVCGDNEGHDTVPELIEYYRTRAIEPFGEYLTSSCFEIVNEELYDTIQVSPRDKPVAAVRAAKHVRKQQTNLVAEQQQHTRPPKTNRRLEEVPPVPQRSRHLDSGPLNDQDRVLYAQLRKQSPREMPRSQHISQGHLPGDNPRRAERAAAQDHSRRSPPSEPHSLYSELNLEHLESSKRRSLPLLDNSSDGESHHRLSAPPTTPPRLSPRPFRQATGGVPRSESSSLECMSDTAVYHLAGRPGSPHTASSEGNSLAPERPSLSVYAEVPNEALFSRLPQDNTYELIPGQEDTAPPKPNSNTYEPLEDVRPKALKNDKWKWLFPESKRKW